MRTATTLTYQWTRRSGPQTTLTGANTQSASYVSYGAAQTYTMVFRLTVSDGVASSHDDVTITIQPATSSPPSVNAGPDTQVKAKESLSLMCTATDPDGDTLTYAWSQATGSLPVVGITTTGPSSGAASIIGPDRTTPTDIELICEVDDGTFKVRDSVTVTLMPPNRAPKADAGTDRTYAVGSAVEIVGTGTDPDGDALWNHWGQTGGSPTVTLGGSGWSRTFTAPTVTTATDLTFTLRVGDGSVVVEDSVTITVTPNRLPNSDPGDPQTVSIGDTVTLDGSASSDPDYGQTLTYLWTQTNDTPKVTLSSTTDPVVTFTAPSVTSSTRLLFTLWVSDGTGSDIQTVIITVRPNQLPSADAGSDQTVSAGSTVTLDGTGSSDPDGDTITYSWSHTSGTPVHHPDRGDHLEPDLHRAQRHGGHLVRLHPHGERCEQQPRRHGDGHGDRAGLDGRLQPDRSQRGHLHRVELVAEQLLRWRSGEPQEPRVAGQVLDAGGARDHRDELAGGLDAAEPDRAQVASAADLPRWPQGRLRYTALPDRVLDQGLHPDCRGLRQTDDTEENPWSDIGAALCPVGPLLARPAPRTDAPACTAPLPGASLPVRPLPDRSLVLWAGNPFRKFGFNCKNRHGSESHSEAAPRSDDACANHPSSFEAADSIVPLQPRTSRP